MVANIFKNTITSLLIFFFVFFFLFSSLFSNNSYAQGPVTETVSISATVGGTVSITPGGSTNTGGGFLLPKTAVGFSGYAYPNADVSLLKQGAMQTKVKANNSGYFSITLEEQYNSSILYSLFAEDVSGNRSLLINYPIVVQVGYFTQLSGIRFAPTIVTDKSTVKAGDYLTVNGAALPQNELQVVIVGTQKKVFSLTSKEDGTYKIILPTSGLPKGEYSVFINYKDDARVSKLVKFIIGESNIFYTEALSSVPGDCNVDKIINLVDFSILAFWYGKPNPPKCVDTNNDNKINLVDFSILAFYWTG